jgi:hypothetical protein
MGHAVDTVAAFSTQAGAGAFPIALAAFPGDTLGVRAFPHTAKAWIHAILYGSNAAGQKLRVVSPLLHDNVTGLTFIPPENPAAFLLPTEAGIELSPVDVITFQGSCGAATTITGGLVNYYENVRGADAHLVRWQDISDNIKYYKSVEVSNGAIAVGAWTDTLITTTENQLHSDKDYAVLGYQVSAACDIVGVKGAFTGNFRNCGPGQAATLDVTEYYINMSENWRKPYIPVFNANDRFAISVSQANHVAIGGGAAEVILIVAELRQRITAG